jgi:ribose/xylose/arabinose/galactoside ABC-type transport system permease subunit
MDSSTDNSLLNNISQMDSAVYTRKRLFDIFSRYGVFFVLILLLLFNSIFTSNFAKINTIWNILIQVTPIILTSLGLTFVIASGGIDISVGSVMAIASIVTAKLLGLGVLPAVLIGLLVSATVGLFNGYMIAKFKLQSIIVTLTIMMAARGLAQVINKGQLLNFDNPSFSMLGMHRIGGIIPIHVVVILIAVAITYFLASHMTFGHFVHATGDNYKAARLSGINTFFITLSVYSLCSFLSGFAGLVETARLSAADASSIGRLMELDAIASVAIGGTPINGGKPRILGTVIGALIIQTVTVSMNMNDVPFSYALVLKSLIIIFAVYMEKERS